MEERKSQSAKLVESLISSSFDKDPDVKQAICVSLSCFGKKQPDLVLSAIYLFLHNHSKIDQMHRLLLLNCLKNIINSCDDINVEVAKKVIALASEDLTNSKKLNKDCQYAAGALLAVLGKNYLIEVVEELLKNFVPGIVAHNYVIQTLGQLAISNVAGMMNHINYVLATTVSQIPQAKSESSRIVFANSLCNFSECICELYSNSDLSKDLPKGAFAHQFNSAFDIFFTGWLNSKNLKVQCPVIQALGKMSLLLPQNELEEKAPKIITVFIAMYRRHLNDKLIVTTALCDVITALTNNSSQVLESTMEVLTTNLHSQVCNMPEEASAMQTKNYNEVLRCFGILASSYSSMLVAMILQRVDARDEKVRAGNILVLKHLINSNPVQIKEHQDMIITGFQKCLFDPSNRVKYNLAKLIITMGTHGFLHREGGQEFVKFVLRQCTLPSLDAPSKVVPSVTNEQLRDMCSDILLLLTTSVTEADKVLWPYLFEFITDQNFTSALGIIFRSLAVLAQNKKEVDADEPLIDFQTTANVTRPVGLLSRMLVTLSHPKSPRMFPDSLFNLLLCLGSSLHEKLSTVFNENIPTLLAFLTENGNESEAWPQEEWEEILLQFLSTILDEVSNEEWTCMFGQALTSQWPLYEYLPEYKSFSFKCLGVVLQKVNNREFVVSYLALLFMSVNHAIPVERKGAAVCMGRCAFTNLDVVLAKLNEYVTANITKKESSYLNIFKSERSLVELDQHRGTASLCCGYIAYYAPPDLILSRLEMNIIKTITNLSKHIKATNIRVEWVTAVHLIASSLDPDRMSSSNQPRYVFAAREDLISKLLSYLKDDIAEKPTLLKASALLACAALVKLDPPMSDMDVSTTFNRSLSHIIPVYKVPSDEQNKNLILLCSNNLNKLLEEMLKKRPNSTRLISIFRHLEPYLTSTSDHERMAAIQLTRILLEKFYDVVVVAETANVLSNTGLLIARILPCCCDVQPSVRIEALICIRQLLRVLNKHHDAASETDNDKMALLDSIGENLISEDMQTVYNTVTELAKMLCSKLPSDLIQFSIGSLTVCLLDSLHWPMLSTAYGACLVLSYIFESRGAMFTGKVDEIISALIGKLTEMQELNRPAQHLDSVLHLLCLITRHHLPAALKALLSYHLPYSPVVQSCWYRLGDDKCSEAVFDYLLESIDRSLPYDEELKKKGKPKQGTSKTATLTSLAIVCALHETIKSSITSRNQNSPLQKYRHRLLSTALVRVGSMYDVAPPPKTQLDPYTEAIGLLHTVMTSLCSSKLIGDIETSGVWNALASKNGLTTLAFAVSCITREIVKHHKDDVTHIVSLLNNYLPSIYDMQRVTVVAFFAQLVRETSTHDEVLLEIVMNNLRSRLVDSHCYVRQLCIIGLSNIVYASQEQIERYSTSVLSAMMAGMDDNDDVDHAIALAAMSGLASFLNKAKQVNIHSMFVNICLRARPCFEKEDPRVRAASVDLFGALGRFADDDLKTAFNEQAHSNLVSLLMHLNDEDEHVRQSCKRTLREIGRFIGSDNLNDTFQKVLFDESTLHYGEFMNNLSKIMINDFPDKLNFYIMECVSFYKSDWPQIRCNAAMVTGFLMTNMSEEHRSNINSEHVCTALIHLLKDSSPLVRSKAAESISLLYLF